MIIANWKMNGNRAQVIEWLDCLQKSLTLSEQSECIFCPPLIYMDIAQEQISLNKMKITLGSQNLDYDSKHPKTGGIDASMLNDLGCKSVIIGHSERRLYFGENNSILSKKLVSASKNNIDIVFCIGETESEKDKGLCHEVLREQLKALNGLQIKKLFIAYEPVWAIGTGKIPSMKYIEEIHHFIKDELKCSHYYNSDRPVLYGGSVNFDNASEISNLDSVNGLLVGGASLNPRNFSDIVKKNRTK